MENSFCDPLDQIGDRMGKFFPPQLRIFLKRFEQVQILSHSSQIPLSLNEITSENSLRFQTRRVKIYISRLT